MGSSKSKLQISNSEVLKEARPLQGVSCQSFSQVNNYFISYHRIITSILLIKLYKTQTKLISFKLN